MYLPSFALVLVIPAKAEIQKKIYGLSGPWIPAYAGITNSYYE